MDLLTFLKNISESDYTKIIEESKDIEKYKKNSPHLVGLINGAYPEYKSGSVSGVKVLLNLLDKEIPNITSAKVKKTFPFLKRLSEAARSYAGSDNTLQNDLKLINMVKSMLT